VKRILFVFMVVSLVMMISSSLVSCSSGTSTSANPIVLRLAVPSPAGDPIVTNVENFVKEFNDAAKGKYIIEVHPGESLVKFPDSLDALRTGAVEIDVWPIGAFSGVDPNFAAAEMPFLVNSIEADAALQVETMPIYSDIMKSKFNCFPLYTFTCLGGDMISNKPIKTAADWKNLLVQSISPQTAKFIEYMGAAGVPIPFPDAYQSMQKGVIEASLQSASMMLQFNMQDVGKYVLRGYLYPAAVAVAINLDVYNKMPKDIQDLIVKLGKKAQTDTNNFFINVYMDNYKNLAAKGLNVYSLPVAERDSWKATLAPYCDQLYAAMDPTFASKLKEIGAALDKKYPYVELK
jgi:TRAP-type C4-dicarboxylate transport system substrate-binding protein